MRKSHLYPLLILLGLFLFACDKDDRLLDFALSRAGQNRAELEHVLAHYKNEPEKLEAARFLIRNMIGKQVLDSNSVRKKQVYFDAFAQYRQTHGLFLYDIQYALYDSIRQSHPHTDVQPRFLLDLRTLSAKFLIQYIDQCFQNWERYPWSKGIDRETFLNYILPYTTDNCYSEQALDYFERKYASLRDTLQTRSYIEVGEAISNDIEAVFLNEWIIFTGEYAGLRPMTFRNIASTLMGTCLEKSTYKIAALRANGIPAVLNIVPCWGNSQYPHSWVEIIGEKHSGTLYDNTQRPFLTREDIKIDGMFWRDVYDPRIDNLPSSITVQYCRTAPKIYRYNYRVQPRSLAMIAREEIPPLFKNPGMEDITDRYVVCEDIEVPLWESTHPGKYVYLCCYDVMGWNPVSWSQPQNGKARFPKMGINMLYLPAYYIEGRIEPAGDAFILTHDGTSRHLSPARTKRRQPATFYSKVPYRMNTALQAAGTIGTRFYVSNDNTLANRSWIHTIEEPPFYVDSFQLPDAQKYRYLICDFQDTEALGYFYAIAEIKAYDKERKELTGHWSGNTGTKGHELPLLSDQDRVSYYQPDRFQENQSIVLDLGSPQPIAQVAFYPRNDDNKIVSGELYELFYWDREWISCGKQYARDNKLVYNGIPENALFRIHNHTRGKEHRPFTYEGGKQIWW